MKYKVLIYSFLASASLWSCFPSYNTSSKEYRKVKADFPKQKVFVMNKELKKEYKILKHSGIYELVDDSTNTAKIQLYPMKIYSPNCGNPMIGSMLTVGLIPSYFSYSNSYNYDLIQNKVTENHQYKLEVYQSLWLFNIFRMGKTFSNQSGKALLGSYLATNK